MVDGYLLVIDAEGGEIPESRREVPATMDREQALVIRAELQRGLGEGCFVEFREEPGGLVSAGKGARRQDYT